MTTGHKSMQAFIWALCLLAGSAFAQSSLPACSGNFVYSDWSYCQGRFNYRNYIYSGEFLNNVPHGVGEKRNFDGSIIDSGVWENGELVNKSVGESASFGQKVAPEIEAERKKRQELDQQLASNKERERIESSLPACQGSDVSRWTSCFGTTTYFISGDKYVGEFKDGNPNGQGTFISPNGAKYVGEIKDGNRHGQGTHTFASGDKYVGEYKDGKRNGQGTYTFAHGSKYVGEYKDGELNGQGTMTFADGNKYVGGYKDGKRHGQGIFYDSSGSITRQGRWENNGLVQSFAIDTQRFPFNSSLTASAIQSPVPDPVKAERDRLAADLEASRKKQQDLEEQLRVSQAAPAPNIRPAVSVPTERRVALVIGNAAYKINPLKNPVNDSNDMARSLRAVGFDVIEANNATLVAMREATRRFADKLVNSDVGLVYYSGHGIEVKGKNYLIPVNADIKREYEVVDQAFDASQFLEMMDSIRGPNNKRVNILLVDACRNNELQRSWRSTNNGLARMDAPGGTFISFATAPGRVAADGLGRNSPYTKHLLQALKQPNMPIEQVFKVVRRNVMDETKGEQIPWDNSSLVGDFFFTVQR